MAGVRKLTLIKNVLAGLNLIEIVKQLIKLLNIHWSDNDEGTGEFDPLPNPKRYLVFNPTWLPHSFYRHIDCGEAS
jgi:hypothetical protein